MKSRWHNQKCLKKIEISFMDKWNEPVKLLSLSFYFEMYNKCSKQSPISKMDLCTHKD